jgi:1-deoxy-D-xylulose-5-phosphate synthase
MKILDRINEANDIKNIEVDELDQLACEIREYLIESVSNTGGHLASNLGCVELTMALHRVLDFPKDKLVWDVGHQSYVHKILTGRKDDMETLRQFEGMSGFPKTAESPCDVFNTGHSSTAISAALGMACSRNIRKTDEKIVAVVGDGAFTGGMVYEAINNMAAIKTGCMVVLNDNNMSIDQNVGGMSTYLSKLRSSAPYNELKGNVEKMLLNLPVGGDKLAKGIKKSKDSIKQMLVPGMFFEELGVTYIGPIDGHDIEVMEATFKRALSLNKPILVHVKTVKGKGYSYAERHPSYFHGIEPFNVDTGKVKQEKKAMTNTGVFGRKLLELGRKNDKLVAITAAMRKGTGVSLFAKEFPERTFDVGIAEEHAVTFAAGLASSGMIPVVAIYSSFLQRAYDQILHDVCLQKLHVIFAVDRSGLVGADGDTHQGMFDTAFLSHIPNMTIIAPKNRYELTAALKWAVDYDGPVAIKYSRGEAYYGLSKNNQPIEKGKSEIISRGSQVAVLAVGNMVSEAETLVERYRAEGKNPTFVNARFIKPIDTQLIEELQADHELIVVLEEGIKHGGYGSLVEEYVMDKGLSVEVLVCAIDDQFVCHGKVDQLRSMLGIDVDSVYDRIESRLTRIHDRKSAGKEED